MRKSCGRQKKKSNHVFGKAVCILAGRVKNSLSNKPTNWYFTHGLLTLLSLWHSPLAMNMANVQKPPSSFILLFFLTTVLFTCDDLFRTRLDFKLIGLILFFYMNQTMKIILFNN